MKRKLFILMLSLVFAFAGVLGITTAFAESEKTDISINNVGFDANWVALYINTTTANTATVTSNNAYAMGKVHVYDNKGTEKSLNGIYTLGQSLYVFVSNGAGGNMAQSGFVKGYKLVIDEGCGVLANEQLPAATYWYDGTAWTTTEPIEMTDISINNVGFDANWVALYINTTTANTASVTSNNAYAMGKVHVYDNKGAEKSLNGIYTLGQSLYVFVSNGAGGNMAQSGFVKGYKLVIDEGCGVLANEQLPAATYWYDGTAWTTTEPVEKTDISINNVGFDASWSAIYVYTTTANTATEYSNNLYAMGKVHVYDNKGAEKSLNGIYTFGPSLYVFVSNGAGGNMAQSGFVKGYKLVIDEGCGVLANEQLPAATYWYDGSAWTTTEPVEEPVEKDPLVINSINYADPWYGASIMVSFGDSTPEKANWAQIETDKIVLKDGEGNVVNVTAETQQKYVLVNRNGVAPSTGWTITFLKGFEIIYKTPVDGITSTGEKIAEDITYIYQEGAPWVVYDPNAVKQEVQLTIIKQGTIDDVNYSMDWGKGTSSGTVVQINFDTENWDGELGLYADISSYNKNYVRLVDAYGTSLELSDITHTTGGYFVVRAATPLYAGGTITLLKGFSIEVGNTVATLANDATYLCRGEMGHSMPVFNNSMVPTSITITNTAADKDLPVGAELQITYALPEGTYGTPAFTVSDDTFASVSKEGKVTALAEGKVTVTATIGEISATYEINVMPAVEIEGVELVNGYTYYVIKGEEAQLPALTAHVVFENGSFGTEFELVDGENATLPEVDTSEEGTQTLEIEIQYKGKTYTVEYVVEVYTPYDLDIKEVAIVDWFAFALFVEYPNSSVSGANVTATSTLHDVVNHITYTRKNGEVLNKPGFYMLKGGNLALFYFSGLSEEPQNSEKYKEYYLEGDVLTLEAGLSIWRWTGKTKATSTDNSAIEEGTGMYIIEAVLKETVQYRYDGNVWGVYVEYEDLAVASAEIEINIDQTVDAGVSRVPANATSGTVVYESSDPSVATVSARGIVTGISEGTATITATISGGPAGEKTVSVQVTVTDSIIGIEFEEKQLSFKVGDNFDATTLNAWLVYASGRKSEKLDLSEATITGLDLTAANNDIMVVSVTVDGQVYSGSIAVSVEEDSGCFGGMTAASAALAFAALGIAALLKRKSK